MFFKLILGEIISQSGENYKPCLVKDCIGICYYDKSSFSP